MRYPDDVEALLGPPAHTAKANLPRGKSADPTLLAEKIRLASEQADKLRLQNAKARGELLPAARVEKEWAAILRDVRAAMLALPSRLQQKLPHLTAHDVAAIDREIRDMLTDLGREIEPMTDRKAVVEYVVNEHFGGDLSRVCEATRFAPHQIRSWLDGTRTPQAANVAYLMHHAFAPTFTIIAEYKRIVHDGTKTGVRKQIAAILKGHEYASGLYAFYDSLANLVYIGKSDGNLLYEAYQQLVAAQKRSIFPKGAPQPKIRLEVVRYVSAYRVSKSAFQDYAKHVESLILRISKPVLNSNLGSLEKASDS